MSVDIAAELQKELENDTLILPTLPEVALRVRDAVDDEDASLTDINRIIATDAALSARLIQVANSPVMRSGRAIESIDMAVNWLGLKLVREMVISMVMEQMFQATSELTDRKLRQIWEHSTAVAAISHALATQFTDLSPQQALLAGLIHDIGVLPILKKVEERPDMLEDEAALTEIIQELHGPIGQTILKAWNFPDELVNVPVDHEYLARDSATVDYSDIVTVANLQSHMGTDHPLAHCDWQAVPAFAKLGLSPEVNVIEMEETAEDIEEAQRMLR